MRIGLIGDLHGNTAWATHLLDEMGKRKISHVYALGDFGLWTHVADGQEFLDEVNVAAQDNNLSVFAVGGNHENWDHWNWFVENMPKSHGMAMVRRRVLLIPKIHHFKLAGRRFVVAGGAVSIDKEERLARERGGRWMNPTFGWDLDMGRGTGSRTLYWPDEQLTDEQVNQIKNTFPKADILLTHDCSNYTEFRGRLKPDMDSEMHRKRIDEVLRAVRPEVHFHGHMHTHYEWENTLGTGLFGSEPEYSIKTYGLEADPEAMYNGKSEFSWGVLETDDLHFAYRGEGMNFRSLND